MVSIPSTYANNDGARIAIAVPVRDTTSMLFTRSLANLMHKCGQDRKPISLHMNHGSNIVSQRQDLASEILKNTRADYILWLDSDMHFPSDLIDKMLNRKCKIVGVPYATRTRPIRSTAFASRFDYNARLNKSTTREKLEKVAALGFGCVLIHRSVFDAMEQPYFGLKWDPGTESVMGEDIYFFEKAANAEFDIFADFELAERVAHIGNKAFTLGDIEE